MTAGLPAGLDLDELVDVDNATQAKRIFRDEAIYRLEVERIFRRCWLFLTHDSLIPNPGDFMRQYMGEDAVLVVRQPDGSIRAFLDACTHRGNRVCFAEAGNAKSFTCAYHGWVFGTDGSLVNVPMENRCYHGQIDKSKLGLPQIRVESYRGFVYGCFDPEAPSLEEYLGDFAWYLDTFMVGPGAGMELLGPPMRSILRCNWKVPCENFVGDAYHIGWTHASAWALIGGPLANIAGLPESISLDDLGLQFTTRFGHGFGMIHGAAAAAYQGPAGEMYRDYLAQATPKVAERLGPERAQLFNGHWDANIFPNNSFLYATNCWKQWHPRGPNEIEVWTWTLVPRDASDELKRAIQREVAFTFGTAGIFESDDGDNMVYCTETSRGPVTREGRMNSQMGKGFEGPHPDYPGIVGSSFIGETSYRGFYRFYKEIMQAGDWAAVRAGDAEWDACFANRDYWRRARAAGA